MMRGMQMVAMRYVRMMCRPSRGRPLRDAWLRHGDGVLHARDALPQGCGVRWLALTWNLGIPFSRSLSAARSLVPQTYRFVKQ
jgi:hypothetical protein